MRLRIFSEVNLQEQFKHLRATLPLLNNRLVFCHNDLLIHNILYDDDKGMFCNMFASGISEKQIGSCAPACSTPSELQMNSGKTPV